MPLKITDLHLSQMLYIFVGHIENAPFLSVYYNILPSYAGTVVKPQADDLTLKVEDNKLFITPIFKEKHRLYSFIR